MVTGMRNLPRNYCSVWVSTKELQEIYALDLSNTFVQVAEFIMLYDNHLQALLKEK